MQENGVDCGVFVIKFIMMIKELCPSSTLHDINQKFRDFFDGQKIYQDVATVERLSYIDDIEKYKNSKSLDFLLHAIIIYFYLQLGKIMGES